MTNRAARQSWPYPRKRVRTPFARIVSKPTKVGRFVAYLHPTKGRRFRRATPQLVVGLSPAFA